MDDIAWLSWRDAAGWPGILPVSAVRDASGIEVDPARVRYYRLSVCRLGPRFGLADMGRHHVRSVLPVSWMPPSTAADGSGLVMNMLHRRMRLTAQADAMGIELPGREIRDEHPAAPRGCTTQCSGIRDVVDRSTIAPCRIWPRESLVR
jgi:hypothetical protein